MDNFDLNMPAVVNHIVTWLKDYAVTNKMDGFVVGVSGGIDSAVVSKLCAMTGLRTVCVIMPIAQSSAETDRGVEHVDNLVELSTRQNINNVELVLYDMSHVFHHMSLTLNNIPVSRLSQEFSKDTEFLARANTRARIRMSAMYYIATIHKLLVTGTGNKIEDFGVGFFTKHGDGGVDLSPIADLYKTEVYQLAETLGIIQEIRDAKPTDGLWTDGRTDEDQLGATYEELEWAMKYLDKFDKDKVVVDVTERQEKVLGIYIDRRLSNMHKMNPIPVCELRGQSQLYAIVDDEVKCLLKTHKTLMNKKMDVIRNLDYANAAGIKEELREIIKKLKDKGVDL